MLNSKFRIVFWIFAIASVFSANAAETPFDFEDKGIRYTILSSTDLTVEVVGFAESFEADGIIEIPQTVDFRERKLLVLGVGKNAFNDINKSSICISLGTLTYIKNQPDTKSLKVYANKIEQFTSGSCYPIASNCEKEYYVGENPLEQINDISTKETEFQRVTNLKRVNLKDNNLTDIPSFQMCENLEYASLPEGAVLPASAFSGCRNLEYVDISHNGMYKAGDAAFYGCTSLKKINGWFDSNTLMRYTFDKCPSLKELSFSKNVKFFRGYFSHPDDYTGDLWYYPFQGTPNISVVNIQSLESWMNIDTRFDSNTDRYYPYFIRSGRTTQGLTNFALKLNGEPIEHINIDWDIYSIKSNTFYGVSTLKSVVLSSNIKSIDSHAFYGCTSLKNVTLNDSLQAIGTESFSGCPIEHLDVPKAITEIGKDAFSHTLSIDLWCPLKNVLHNFVGNKTQEISFHSTDKTGRFVSSSLKRINVNSRFDDSTSKIFYFDKNAFSSCPNLEELNIEIMETPYAFEENCFAGTALKSLIIPNWPTICSGAFKNCTQLTHIVFNGSANIMGHSDFQYEWNGTDYAGVGPFYNCTNLESITFNNNLNITQWYKSKGSSGGRTQYYLSSIRLTPWYNCPISKFIVNADKFDIDRHMNVEHPLKHLVLREQTNWIHMTGYHSREETSNASNRFHAYSYEYKIDPEIIIECHNPIPPVIDGTLPTNVYVNATIRVPKNSIELYRESPSWKPFWIFETMENAGLEEITDNHKNSTNDIYNLQGMCIKREATQEDVKALPPGMYIIGNKKIIVK